MRTFCILFSCLILAILHIFSRVYSSWNKKHLKFRRHAWSVAMVSFTTHEHKPCNSPTPEHTAGIRHHSTGVSSMAPISSIPLQGHTKDSGYHPLST